MHGPFAVIRSVELICFKCGVGTVFRRCSKGNSERFRCVILNGMAHWRHVRARTRLRICRPEAESVCAAAVTTTVIEAGTRLAAISEIDSSARREGWCGEMGERGVTCPPLRLTPRQDW